MKIAVTVTLSIDAERILLIGPLADGRYQVTWVSEDGRFFSGMAGPSAVRSLLREVGYLVEPLAGPRAAEGGDPSPADTDDGQVKK